MPISDAPLSSARLTGSEGMVPLAKPMDSSRPPSPSARKARSVAAPPTGSTTTSRPRPSVQSRTWARQSSTCVSMAAWAPARKATRRFSSLDAEASTRAPMAAATANCTAARPTAPAAPSTSTVSPGCSRAACVSAWYEQPKPPRNTAASSKLMRSGKRSAAASRTSVRSAYLPPTPTQAQTQAIRSPVAKRVTPAPSATTTPDTSLPGMNGNGTCTWCRPLAISASTNVTPAECTSTCTSPTAGGAQSSTAIS